MHLLTTRGGEVVCLFEPLRDDPGCTGSAGLVGLDSAQLVEFATVADRPDTGTTALVSAAASFLKRSGWVDQDPEVIAEYALDMMALCTEVASRYPPGTKIRAALDDDADEWLITHLNQRDDPRGNPPQPPPSRSGATVAVDRLYLLPDSYAQQPTQLGCTEPTGAPKASPLAATAAPSGRSTVIARAVGGVVAVAALVSILPVVGHGSSHKHAAQPPHQVSYSSQVELPVSALSDPSGVEVDGAGNVYVLDHGNNRVVKLAQASGAPAVLPFTGLNDPSWVEVDGAGDVYVADHTNNRVVKLAQGSGAQAVVPFAGLNGPIGVAVDTGGAVYVVDTGNNRVVKFAQGSRAQTALPFTGLNHPHDVAVGGAGDVYVADSGNNRVVKLTQDSGVQTVLPFTGLNDPRDVAVDAAGTVYVADYNNNRVLKLQAM